MLLLKEAGLKYAMQQCKLCKGGDEEMTDPAEEPLMSEPNSLLVPH